MDRPEYITDFRLFEAQKLLKGLSSLRNLQISFIEFEKKTIKFLYVHRCPGLADLQSLEQGLGTLDSLQDLTLNFYE